MPATGFRPEIDGYAFDNTWALDAAEKAKIQEIVDELLPKVLGVLSPILLAAAPLLGAILGPAIILAGPFLPLIIHKLVKKLVKALADEIDSDATTWCGGLAFSAMDYWLMNWAVPRGDNSGDHPQPLENGGTAASTALREYIWNRLVDCQLANLETSIVWHIMLKFLGSWGKDYVLKKTRHACETVQASIDAGKPRVIWLIHPGADPSIDHVVIVTAYELRDKNYWYFSLYDDDTPTVTQPLVVDARKKPLFMEEPNRIDADGNPRIWNGMFVPDYTPKQPPPAIVATGPLQLHPVGSNGEGLPVDVSFPAKNQGFHQTLPALLGAGLADEPWVMFQDSGQPVVTQEDTAIKMTGTATAAFNTPGLYELIPKVVVWPDPMAPPTASKQPSIKVLPHPDGSVVAPVPYRVTPAIPISGEAYPADDCMPPFVAGLGVEFKADVLPVATVGITGYTWEFTGAVDLTSHDTSPVIATLPAANSKFHVALTVKLADGTAAFGELDVTVMDALVAAKLKEMCELLHAFERPLDDWLDSAAAREAPDPARFASTVNAMADELRATLGRTKKG